MTNKDTPGPERQFLAGMAALADPAAAPDWRRSVELIDAAAASGMAEAIERRALFECMGLGRPANRGKAIESLAEAAQQGSRSAAGQLDVLRDGPSRPASGFAPRDLSSNPLIRTFDAFASRAECEWLISSATPRLQRATVYRNDSSDEDVDSGRSNQFALLDIVNMDVVAETIRARIADAIHAPLPCLEVSQILRYSIGEEFAPHCDFLDAQTHSSEIARRGQRAATVLIYLNDDFEGGETSFPELGIDHRAKKGDALVFSNVDRAGRPDLRTLHAGRPPTRGEKWVFSQWVRDRLPT